LHDFNTKSVKLHLVTPLDPHDPSDPGKRTRVLLSLAHLVRLVPQYFLENDGKRMVMEIGEEEEQAALRRQRGLKRAFLVYDDAGGCYESWSASREAQALLEQIWSESA